MHFIYFPITGILASLKSLLLHVCTCVSFSKHTNTDVWWTGIYIPIVIVCIRKPNTYLYCECLEGTIAQQLADSHHAYRRFTVERDQSSLIRQTLRYSQGGWCQHQGLLLPSSDKNRKYVSDTSPRRAYCALVHGSCGWHRTLLR